MDLMSRPPLAGIGARFGAILLDGLLPSLIMIPAAITGYVMLSSLTASLFQGMSMGRLSVVIAMASSPAARADDSGSPTFVRAPFGTTIGAVEYS